MKKIIVSILFLSSFACLEARKRGQEIGDEEGKPCQYQEGPTYKYIDFRTGLEVAVYVDNPIAGQSVYEFRDPNTRQLIHRTIRYHANNPQSAQQPSDAEQKEKEEKEEAEWEIVD